MPLKCVLWIISEWTLYIVTFSRNFNSVVFLIVAWVTGIAWVVHSYPELHWSCCNAPLLAELINFSLIIQFLTMSKYAVDLIKIQFNFLLCWNIWRGALKGLLRLTSMCTKNCLYCQKNHILWPPYIIGSINQVDTRSPGDHLLWIGLEIKILPELWTESFDGSLMQCVNCLWEHPIIFLCY